MTKLEILDQIISEIEEMKSEVSKTFYYVEEDVLQKKPSQQRWSALQCFEHINLTNRFYLKQIDRFKVGAEKTKENPKYSAGWAAAYMIRNIKPKDGRISWIP